MRGMSVAALAFICALLASSCSRQSSVPHGSLGVNFNAPHIQGMFDRMITGDREALTEADERGVHTVWGILSITLVYEAQGASPGTSLCKRYRLVRLGSDAPEVGTLCKDDARTHGKWVHSARFREMVKGGR